MGRMQALLALGAGVAAALVLAACGGDSSPEQAITLQTDTQSGAALSKADFIQEADQRCEEVNSAIGKLVEQGEGFTGAGEIADLRQGLLDDLKNLGPPEEDRASLDKYITALEDQAQAGQKIALAIDRNEDTTQFETDLSDAQAQAEAAATDYGFKVCGSQITATDTSGGSTSSSSGSSSSGSVPVTPAPAAPVTPPPSSGGGTGTGGGTGGGGGIGVP